MTRVNYPATRCAEPRARLLLVGQPTLAAQLVACSVFGPGRVSWRSIGTLRDPMQPQAAVEETLKTLVVEAKRRVKSAHPSSSSTYPTQYNLVSYRPSSLPDPPA